MTASKLRPVGFDPQTDPGRLELVDKVRFAVFSPSGKGGPIDLDPIRGGAGMVATRGRPSAVWKHWVRWWLGSDPLEVQGSNVLLPAAQVGATWLGRWEQHDLGSLESVAAIRPSDNYVIALAWVDPSQSGPGPTAILTVDPVWGFTAQDDNTQNGGVVARVCAEPTMFVLVESDGCTDKDATTRIHAISTDPAMPEVVVRTPILGLTKAEDDTVVRDYQLTLVHAKQGRNDRMLIRKSVPGPRWEVDWGGDFAGGDLTVAVTATLPWGEKVKATQLGQHLIWGMNPAKSAIRARIPDVAMQVAVFRESRFTQFSKRTAVGTLNTFQPGPLPVLQSYDDGFGIGQLTNSPEPATNQLWNWQDNADETRARLTQLRHDVAAWVAAKQQQDPLAPAMTQDQQDLEMWKRYNSGRAYHTYSTAQHAWVPHLNAYADDCLTMRNKVQAGQYPPGWIP